MATTSADVTAASADGQWQGSCGNEVEGSRSSYLRIIRTLPGAWIALTPVDVATDTLLAGEYHAPQDIDTRPAVRDPIRTLLFTGRTGPDLRGLARRSGHHLNGRARQPPIHLKLAFHYLDNPGEHQLTAAGNSHRYEELAGHQGSRHWSLLKRSMANFAATDQAVNTWSASSSAS
jgi:hypothetical protein